MGRDYSWRREEGTYWLHHVHDVLGSVYKLEGETPGFEWHWSGMGENAKRGRCATMREAKAALLAAVGGNV